MQLAVLRRARFGRSSEKLDRDIEQLELLIGELEEEQAEGDARAAAAGHQHPQAPARERKQPVRKPLSAHLPREAVTHEPPCVCPGCGSTVFSRIGQDEREVLEYVPSSFKVIRHVRPKLSCRACETVVQLPMPALPIERGRPGPGLIVHVLVSKLLRPHPALSPGGGLFLRVRCRRPARRLHLHPGRDRQDDGHQPASLPGRHSWTHRRISHPSNRHPACLALDTVAKPKVRTPSSKPQPTADVYRLNHSRSL